MTTFLGLVASGLGVGAIYGLVALGFVLIYKSSKVINFAVGEFLAFGAYFCWALLVQAHFPTWLGVILTLAMGAILGLVVEHLALRPMIGQPLLAVIMATLAISILLSGIMTLIWGGPPKAYPHGLIPRGIMEFGGIVVPTQLVWCFVIGTIGIAILILFFQRTKSGLFMRATAEDHQVAQAAGIGVKGIFALTWAIAILVCAVAGILVGSVRGINVEMGVVGLKVFPAVLLGGLESIPGAIIGGFIIGILEKLAAGYLNPLVTYGGVEGVFPFFVMILILIFRPYGLFGLRIIERI